MMSDEDQAAFAMWVTGLILLPIGLVLFLARRLIRRAQSLGGGG